MHDLEFGIKCLRRSVSKWVITFFSDILFVLLETVDFRVPFWYKVIIKSWHVGELALLGVSFMVIFLLIS